MSHLAFSHQYAVKPLLETGTGLLEGRIRWKGIGRSRSAFMSPTMAITVVGLSSLKTGFYQQLTASRSMKFQA